jgi:hypothetical protein
MIKYIFACVLELSSIAASAQACARKDAYAMSPYDMKCVYFDSSCDVPSDWIKVSTCDLKKYSEGLLPKDFENAKGIASQIQSSKNNVSPIDAINEQMKNKIEREVQGPSGMNFFMGKSSNSFFNKE